MLTQSSQWGGREGHSFGKRKIFWAETFAKMHAFFRDFEQLLGVFIFFYLGPVFNKMKKSSKVAPNQFHVILDCFLEKKIFFHPLVDGSPEQISSFTKFSRNSTDWKVFKELLEHNFFFVKSD